MRREIEVYDRNREALYDLRQPELRIAIHELMIRMTLAIEGVLDPFVGEGGMTPDELTSRRELSFEFLEDQIREIEPIVRKLGDLSQHHTRPPKP